ncbi:MAG: AAA family ATPase [Sedimentisphaerales bacterium]|jgi:chromosome partitioning protein|nr:AAA family ATPase [Sedimentisphaerales bacterium]NLT76499.1 ParA family protein [Planctomycetota bacterium]
MKIIAVVNQKGGCGKTTTAVNLSVAFAKAGRRVLLVDLDPQGHATMGMGFDPDSFQRTVYDGLAGEHLPISRVVVSTDIEWLDLAPSNVGLARAELELINALGKELVLGEWLHSVADHYDMCLIDCPPSLGLLMLNALVASSDVIIPVQVHFYAFEGLKRLLETIRLLKKRFHPCSARTLGLLLTFVEDRPTYTRRIQLQLRELFGDLVFDTVIHKTIRLVEAPDAGKSIFTFAPDSKAAREYATLVDEIEARLRTSAPSFAGT